MRPIINLDFPLFIKWYITSRCNLRCSHCYLKDYKQTAALERILPIVDFLGNNGVQGVVLIGGEPLTRPDVEQIVEHLTHYGINVKIATNALLATPERAQTLVASGVTRFQVSVEGASAQDNDPIRGKGTFVQILQGARNLQAAGASVALAVTVTKQNYLGIPDIFRMTDELGLKRIKFNAFIPIGTGSCLVQGHALTPAISAEVSRVIAAESKRFRDITVEAGAFHQIIEFQSPEKKVGPTLGCGAGTSSLIINSDFTLSACDMLVEQDRTSKEIENPADIGVFWREHQLFKKWRGQLPPNESPDAAAFSDVHQHGCHVAYRAYGENIFRYGCK